MHLLWRRPFLRVLTAVVVALAVFAYVSFNFFARRIPFEEHYLQQFFGSGRPRPSISATSNPQHCSRLTCAAAVAAPAEYELYRRTVWSGIPGVP